MPLPVISVAEMREWEKASWAAGCTEAAVIERVGKSVAERALTMTTPGDLVLLLAGMGHNGDDVRAAAPHLAGRKVELINFSDPKADLADVKAALARRPALVVDGLFGIGLNRPLEGAWVDVVNAVNDASLPVLAVDVPSGLNADTGAVVECAINATVTLTVGTAKRGLLAVSAAPWVGRLEVANDVGLVPCPIKSELNWTMAEDFSEFPPRRPASGHKGTFGHLVIMAGSLGYHGAAVMAAEGALRAMPGLVSLLTPFNVYGAVASQLRSVMVHPLRVDHPLLDERDAFLIGPGLVGAELRQEAALRVNHLWVNSPAALVVDASALDWLQPGPLRHPELRVITPHPGEAARMLQVSTGEVQADRVEAVRELSKRHGECWVILKGAQTVVGRSHGGMYVNCSGNSGLGQGGSGDVLAGYIAGLLAQPALRGACFRKTLRYAVWQHGATADALAASRRIWTIDQLVGALGNTGTRGQ